MKIRLTLDDAKKILTDGGSFDRAFQFIPVMLPCEHEEELPMLEWEDAIDAGNVVGSAPRVWGFADSEFAPSLVAVQLQRLPTKHLAYYLQEFGRECQFDAEELAQEVWMERLGECMETDDFDAILQDPIKHLKDFEPDGTYTAFTLNGIIEALSKQMVSWMQGNRDETATIEGHGSHGWIKQVLNQAEDTPTPCFIITEFHSVELDKFDINGSSDPYLPDILDDDPGQAFFRCVNA